MPARGSAELPGAPRATAQARSVELAKATEAGKRKAADWVRMRDAMDNV